jgi:hypothetical protein
MMSTTVTVIAPRLNCCRNLTHGVSSPKTLRNFSVPPRYSYCTATKASKSPDRIFAAAPGISSVSSPRTSLVAELAKSGPYGDAFWRELLHPRADEYAEPLIDQGLVPSDARNAIQTDTRMSSGAGTSGVPVHDHSRIHRLLPEQSGNGIVPMPAEFGEAGT